MPLDLPAQNAVDRRVPYEIPLVDIPLTGADGTLVEVLQDEIGGSFGGMPGDPPPWSRRIDPGDGYCRLLTAQAAVLCWALRGAL